METSVSRSNFDAAYETGEAPWIIGEPQPVVVELEREGWIRGAVLDAGCGTGEHTIYLTGRGHDVRGIDFSPRAIETARANAAQHRVTARFEVADALRLGAESLFDTILDSALFHVFSPEDRLRYTDRLHAASRPGALVHVLALSDAEPGIGPRISDTAIRDGFGDGWVLEDLRPSRYRVVIGPQDGAQLNRPAGKADMPGWLARARRS